MKKNSESNVTFIEHLLPQLEDGGYSFKVTQTVKSKSGKVPDKKFESEKTFTVQGERFSLNPDVIASVFPPPFSLGEFYNVLPHVVLAKPTLPWERSIGGHESGKSIPWLGVLVFDEDDGVKPAVESTVINLLQKKQATKSGEQGELPVDTYYPPFPVKQGETWAHLDYGEQWSDTCMIIDVPAAIFSKTAPTVADLEWMAHNRRVETINKSESYLKKLGVTASTPADVVTVAEVIGNRFPKPSHKATAHLVSLQNFADVLPGENGESHLPEGLTKVRLVSLYSWNFESISARFSFSGLLQKVNKPNGVFSLNTLQIDPAGITNPAVLNAVNMGFTAFNHRTRMSDRTVSWYHGPFVPYQIDNTVPDPGNNSDQFTRYNPDSGMFDVSYSSAFQLGRLLGLQDNNFSTALYNWKRGMIKQTIRHVEKSLLPLSSGGIADLLRTALGNYAVSTVGHKTLASKLTGKGVNAKKKPPFKVPASMPVSIAKLKQKRLTEVRRVLSDHRKILQLHTANETATIPTIVVRFLARLKLLYGVPFNYIVADPRMLPIESLRFFYVDDAWIQALTEGALSIARSTSSESAVDRAMGELVFRHSHHEKGQVRRTLFSTNEKPLKAVNTASESTGFLLRSQVVEGWPGLEVIGLDQNGNTIDLQRMEHVGPGILLCIFNGIVRKVYIKEQAEQLHFGVQIDNDDPEPRSFHKGFRYIVLKDGHQPGEPVKGVVPMQVNKYVRTTESSVLRMEAFAAAMKQDLNDKIGYSGAFTSAEYGLEMVEGVQQVEYIFETLRSKAKLKSATKTKTKSGATTKTKSAKKPKTKSAAKTKTKAAARPKTKPAARAKSKSAGKTKAKSKANKSK